MGDKKDEQNAEKPSHPEPVFLINNDLIEHVWCKTKNFLYKKWIKNMQNHRFSQSNEIFANIANSLANCTECMRNYYQYLESLENEYKYTLNIDRILYCLENGYTSSVITEIYNYNWYVLKDKRIRDNFEKAISEYIKKERIEFRMMSFAMIFLFFCSDTEIFNFALNNIFSLQMNEKCFLHTGNDEWDYILNYIRIPNSNIYEGITKKQWLCGLFVYLGIENTYFTEEIIDELIKMFFESEKESIKLLIYKISYIIIRRMPYTYLRFKELFKNLNEINIVTKITNLSHCSNDFGNYIFWSPVHFYINSYDLFYQLNLKNDFYKSFDYLTNKFNKKNLFSIILKYPASWLCNTDFICNFVYFEEFIESLCIEKEPAHGQFIEKCINYTCNKIYKAAAQERPDFEFLYILLNRWNRIILEILKSQTSLYRNTIIYFKNFIILSVYNPMVGNKVFNDSHKVCDLYYTLLKNFKTLFSKNIYLEMTNLSEEHKLYMILIRDIMDPRYHYDPHGPLMETPHFNPNLFASVIQKMELYYTQYSEYPFIFEKLMQILQRINTIHSCIYLELLPLIKNNVYTELLLKTLTNAIKKLAIDNEYDKCIIESFNIIYYIDSNSSDTENYIKAIFEKLETTYKQIDSKILMDIRRDIHKINGIKINKDRYKWITDGEFINPKDLIISHSYHRKLNAKITSDNLIKKICIKSFREDEKNKGKDGENKKKSNIENDLIEDKKMDEGGVCKNNNGDANLDVKNDSNLKNNDILNEDLKTSKKETNYKTNKMSLVKKEETNNPSEVTMMNFTTSVFDMMNKTTSIVLPKRSVKKMNATTTRESEIIGFIKLILSPEKEVLGDISKNIPLKFSDFAEYFWTFLPLIREECHAQIHRTNSGEITSKGSFQIQQAIEINECLEVQLQMIKLISGADFSDYDFVHLYLIESNPIPALLLSTVSNGNNLTISVRTFNTNTKLEKNLILRVEVICNLTTSFREYQALNFLENSNFLNLILSPKSFEVKHNPNNLKLFKNILKANDSQALAIDACCNKNPIVLIQGPPGTGKTKTIIGIVSAFMSGKLDVGRITGKSRVLICAPSNAAVDDITRKIGQGIDDLNGKKIFPNLIRFGVSNSQNNNIRKFTLENLIESINAPNVHLTSAEKWKRKISILEKSDVVCATLSSSGHESISSLNLSFDVLIIDEACQAAEISTLIPLKLNPKKIILVGDPCQLPPTLLSNNPAYEQTLFQRIEKTVNPLLLSIQYRMHPSIAGFSNFYFYNNMIKTDNSVNNRINPYSGIVSVLKFVNTGGKEFAYANSYYNLAEINLIITFIVKIKHKLKNHSLGIISFYKGQVEKIRMNLIKRLGNSILDLVDVNTVDGFQGQEKDIIIISCVRTAGLGFITDLRRINVAITRAKHGLYIFGDRNNLIKDPCWGNFINYIKKNTFK
ncbi:hypothetical protein TCON_0137 [Astathelohania contejeani]|uniref:Uncharacterized protein n=1 Tax=Astathelohania contejeani TaxID=164912 RepID=A0ABQ7I2R0_9MICR|nr:hypothetical protein TCON_0137 [Thelohania contejeani]